MSRECVRWLQSAGRRSGQAMHGEAFIGALRLMQVFTIIKSSLLISQIANIRGSCKWCRCSTKQHPVHINVYWQIFVYLHNFLGEAKKPVISILKVACAVLTVLTLRLPCLLCNADNECEAETHQTLLLLLLIMRSYANIGAAPRVNSDNCRVRGYNTQL